MHISSVFCAAMVALGAAASAEAGTITAFDSTTEAYNHGQYIGTNASVPTAVGPLAQSFITPGFAGSILALSLDLDCNQNDGSNGKCSTGLTSGSNSSSYSNFKTVSTAVTNQNTLTLSNTTGITVGSWIMGGGVIAPGTVYVTAINGNQVTLSKPVTIGTNAVGFAADGSFTVNLYASTVTGISHSSTSLNLASVPSGTPLATVTLYDAGLYLQAGLTFDTSAPTLLTFANPFPGTTLSANTAYWIQLSNNVPNGTSTLVEWDFMKGASGTGVAGNYWTSQLADNSTCPAHPTACSWLDGGSTNPLNVAGEFGMDVFYAPEPATIALLGVGILGLGLARRRGQGSVTTAQV